MLRNVIIQKKRIWIAGFILLVLHIFLLVRHIDMPNMMHVIDPSQVTQEEYDASVKNREELAKKQGKFAIFSEGSSFTKISSEKEQKDYADCRDIHIEKGNNKVVTTLLSDTSLPYILCAFAFYVVLHFYRERDYGVWPIVHSTPGGRGKLAVKRCLVLGLKVVLFGIVLYFSSIFTLICILGGNVGWNRSIQSVAGFMNIPQCISLWKLLLESFGLHIIGAFCFGLVSFLIFSIWREKLFAYLTIIGVMFLEWIFMKLPLQSDLVIARYCNLYHFIDLRDVLLSYRNLSVPFIGIAGNLSFSFMTCLCTVCVSTVLICLVNKYKMPSHQETRIERWFYQILAKLRIPLSYFPLWAMECYKQLWGQRKWCVLAVLIIICFRQQDTGMYVQSSEQEFVDQFYEKYEGPIDAPETLGALHHIQSENKSITKEYETALSGLQNGTVSQDEFEKISNHYYAKEAQMKGYAVLKSETKRLQKIGNRQNRTMHYVKQQEYETVFSFSYWNTHNKTAILAILALILLLFDSFYYESKMGMRMNLNSTLLGWSRVLRTKIELAVFYGVAVWGIVYLSQWYDTFHENGLYGLHAPVQSLKCLQYITWNCSILQFMMLLAMYRLLFCVVFALLVFGFSMVLHPVVSVLLTSCMFVFPSVLYAMDVEVMGRFAISKCLVAYWYACDRWIKLAIYLLVLLVMLCLFFFCGTRKWKQKK